LKPLTDSPLDEGESTGLWDTDFVMSPHFSRGRLRGGLKGRGGVGFYVY